MAALESKSSSNPSHFGSLGSRPPMAHHQLSPTWFPPLANLLPLTLVALPFHFLTIFGDMSNLKPKVQFCVKFLALEVDLF